MIKIDSAFYGTDNNKIDITEYIQNNHFISKDQSIQSLYQHNDLAPNQIKKISVLWTKSSDTELIIHKKNPGHIKPVPPIDIHFTNFYSFRLISSKMTVNEIQIRCGEETYKMDVQQWASFCISEDEFLFPEDFEMMNDDRFKDKEYDIKILYHRDTQYHTVVYENHNGHLLKDLIIGIEPHLYKFNLIYHMYIRWSHPLMNLHLQYLKKIAPLFNNRIIISIVSDDDHFKHHENHLRNELSGINNLEFIFKKNNPGASEAISFNTLISSIKTNNEDEYTFYAHSKGLKYNLYYQYQAAGLWTEIMYIFNLSNYDSMIYHRYNMGGSFRLDSPVLLGNSHSNNWHYSGTFYWIKHNQTFFTYNISDSQDYYLSEKYPGLLYPSKQGCACFFNNPSSNIFMEVINNPRVIHQLKQFCSFIITFLLNFPLIKELLNNNNKSYSYHNNHHSTTHYSGTLTPTIYLNKGGGGVKHHTRHNETNRPTFENRSINRFR